MDKSEIEIISEESACRDEDTTWFFSLEKGDIDRAITVFCDNCDVREKCLDYALNFNIEDGVWGGLGPEERKSLRRHLLRNRSKKVA